MWKGNAHMNIQSISVKAWLFTATFALLLFMQFFVQYSAQLEAKNELISLHEKQLVMVHHAYSLKNSTTQVQQWLTDISATRGQDGLNDGFDLAEEYARTFQQTVDKLISLDSENSRQYELLVPIFKEYHKTGQLMAKAYVEEGPSGGNKLMESFDQDAERINQLVDKILEETKTSMDKGIVKEISKLNADLDYLIIFSVLFVILLVLLVVANKVVLSKPMAKLSGIIKTMAAQQRESGSVSINTDDLNKNTKTELGSIAYWLNDLLSAITEQNKEALKLANDNKRIKDALDACSTNANVDMITTLSDVNPMI